MGPRARYDFVLGQRRPGHARGRIDAPLLRRISGELRAWQVKASLPRLTQSQRLDTARKDFPDLHQILRAMTGVVSDTPDLAAGLQLSAQVVDALRQKDVQLHVIIGHASSIAESAAANKRLYVYQIKEASDHVLATARRLYEGSPDPLRASARDLLAGVDTFDTRRERSRKARKERIERRLAPLEARLQQTNLNPAVSLPSPSLIIAPTDGDFPTPLPAPERPRSPRQRDDDLGAPQDWRRPLAAPATQFLDAPVSSLSVCAATVGQARDLLSLDGQPPPPDTAVDYVYYMEIGAYLADALEGAPLIQTEAGVSSVDLAALCEACTAYSLTEVAALHLVQGAQDGHLCIAFFANLCYEDMESWIKSRLAGSRDPAVTEPLRTSLLTLSDARGRAMERAKEHGKQTQARISDLEARIAQAEADANLSRVKERLGRGQKVSPEAYHAAADRQAEIAAAAAADQIKKDQASRKQKR
jgi:hypothetical protein